MASWFGKDRDEKLKAGLPDEKAVSVALNMSVAAVRKARKDKRVMARVREALEEQLLYDVVEIRPIIKKIAEDESVRAENRLKAARTIEELAGNLKRGPAVEMNTMNIHPTVYSDVSDDQLLDQLDRIAKERGFRKPE